MTSVMGALMKAFGPSMEYAAPNPMLAVTDFRKTDMNAGYAGETDQMGSPEWDADAVVSAMNCDTADAALSSTNAANSAGQKRDTQKVPIVAGSSALFDELFQACRRGDSIGSTSPPTAAETAASAGQRKAPKEGNVSLTFLSSPKVREECQEHMRELHALRCVLQRPPLAYNLIPAYNALFYKLAAAESDNFVDLLVMRVEAIWRKGVRVARGEALLLMTELLCLYCEVIFFLSLHCERNAMTAGDGDVDDDGGEHMVRDATHSASNVVHTTLSKSTALRRTLLTVIAEMGGDVHPDRCPNLLQPRRCAVLLATLCLSVIGVFQQEDVSAALSSAAGGNGLEPKDTVLNFCRIAMLPGAIKTQATGGAATEHASEIVSMMCRTTIYDLDLTTLFVEEGAAEPLLRDMSIVMIGDALGSAWHLVSASVWRHFTRDALASACRSMRLYTWTWRSIPAAVLGLLTFVDEGLTNATQSFTEAEEARRSRAQASSSITSNVEGGEHSSTERSRGPRGANRMALLAGALGYGDGGGYDNTDEQETSNRNRDLVSQSGTNNGGDGVLQGTLDGPVCFHFSDPANQVTYFLSLHAYLLGSLSCVCGTFNDLCGNFLWRAPPLPTKASTPSDGTQNSGVTDPREIPTWASLLPVAPVLVNDEGATKLNLLHQVFAHLGTLARSPEQVQMLCSSSSVLGEAGAATVAASSDRAQSEKLAVQVLYYDASLTLMYHLFIAFAHELRQISQFARVDAASTFAVTAIAVVRANPVTNAYRPLLVYALLHRFIAMVDNVAVPASMLLQKGLLQSVGGGQPIPVTIAYEQLSLFVRLVKAQDLEAAVAAEVVHPARLFLSLVYLEPGVLSSTADGVSYFAFYIRQLFELLLMDAPNLQSAINGNGVLGAASPAVGHDDIVKAVGNVHALLPFVSPEMTTALVAHLCDGIAGLLRCFSRGQLVMGGTPICRTLSMALQLLAEVVRLSGQASSLATLLLQPIPGYNDDHGVPFSYFLLASIFQMPGLTVEVMEPAAQLLCAAVTSAPGTASLYPTLRSHLSKPLLFGLATSLHRKVRAEAGSAGNAVRMETLRILVEHDMATAERLIGPESLPGNREALELTDLIIVKSLSQLIQSGKPTSLPEKAAALRVLTSLGLTGAIPVSRVMTLMTEAANDVSSAYPPYTVVDFVAAAASYINAVAMQSASARREEAAARGRSEPPTPQMSSTASGGGRGASSSHPSVTPLVLGSSGGGGASSTVHSEAIDAVLRRGSECLIAAARCYESLSATKLTFTDTSVALSRDAGAAVGEGVSVLSQDAALPGHLSLALTRVGGSGGTLTLGAANLEREPRVAQSLTHMATSGFGSAARGQSTFSKFITTTSLSRAPRSVYHTEALPDVIADVTAYQGYLYPLQLGPQFRFRPLHAADHDEVVTGTLNELVSCLEAMVTLTKAMEASVWMSSGDSERNALFIHRSLSVLYAALESVLMNKPSAPALASSTWVLVQRGLTLAVAAAHTLEAGTSLFGREGSLGSAATHAEMGRPGIGARRALRSLVEFAKSNTTKLPIVNGCLQVFFALPSAVMELGVAEDIFTVVLSTLQPLRAKLPDTLNSIEDEVELIKNTALLFERLEPNSCPMGVMAYLLPAVFRRAKTVSHAIVANDAEGPFTKYFSECVECLRSGILHSQDPLGAASFLPAQELIGLFDALGRFSCSVAAARGPSNVHERQSWHTAWCGVLELLLTIVTCVGSVATNSAQAQESQWISLVGGTAEHLPRFLLAVGAFTDIPESSRAYYVWDVREMALCTQLVAVIAAQRHPLRSLLPNIHRAFLHIHRFRLLRGTVATSSLPETAAEEARTMERLFVQMVRYQLSFFLSQGAHGVPLSMLTEHDGPVVVYLQSNLNAVAGADAPHLTFTDLRRFIVQELNAIRQVGLETGKGAGSSSSTRGSETPTAPALPPSRESSVPPTPSRPRDTDTVATDEDTCTVAEALMWREVAQNRSLHIDMVQLALALFTTAAEEVLQRRQELAAGAPTVSAMRELRDGANKLLHVLDSVKRDLQRMNSPTLKAIATLVRERIKAIANSP